MERYSELPDERLQKAWRIFLENQNGSRAAPEAKLLFDRVVNALLEVRVWGCVHGKF